MAADPSTTVAIEMPSPLPTTPKLFSSPVSQSSPKDLEINSEGNEDTDSFKKIGLAFLGGLFVTSPFTFVIGFMMLLEAFSQNPVKKQSPALSSTDTETPMIEDAKTATKENNEPQKISALAGLASGIFIILTVAAPQVAAAVLFTLLVVTSIGAAMTLLMNDDKSETEQLLFETVYLGSEHLGL
ncbi:MAG: hypothetical protein GKR77_01095 [Legionellales bacterium]|nr:hypothetical protein [Legionellales bacterium]